MKNCVVQLSLLPLLIGCDPQKGELSSPLKPEQQTTDAPTPTCPVRIEASVSNAVFKPNDDIVVHLALAFDGTVIYLEQPDFFHNYGLEVLLPGGVVAQLSETGARFYNEHVGGSVQRGRVGLHFVDTYDFPLSKLYDFSLKGEYRVRFAQSICSAPQSPDPTDPQLPKPQYVGPVYSNYVIFRIR